ncbi:MAG: hypothetical protein JO351_05580 [Candidatus Eremiobacteraeota bacterium]|nr:hypothetical protein [Candidatus Eremiobacteraeota bacterium]MBV9056093.1 hypothetical protein [Candidatus Eremiobacteraeota bacterium]
MKTFRIASLPITFALLALAGCGSSHLPGLAPAAGSSQAQRLGEAARGSERVLYSFTGYSDGGNAATGLVLDSAGNLYGTTVVGGSANCGTVFKLAPRSSPPWTESVLFSFDCYGTGKNPHGGVTFDRAGNLDGTTVNGGGGGSCGSSGCGVVFQVSGSNEQPLYSFRGGNDGFGPGSPVTIGAKDVVYGTAPDGGADSQGVVYAVSRKHGNWHQSVLHPFTGGSDGGTGSLGALLLLSGDLYGVAETGGAHGAGTAYRLSPAGGGAWKFTPLYQFKGAPDAGSPYGGLIADASGNLYGTTYYGGANNLGSVFELSPAKRGRYHERVLYSFKGGRDGSSPTSTLIFGANGVLYGTASAGGGSCGCGTIFKLNVTTGKEKTLHRFGNGADGANPYYGLARDPSGNFYGATVAGGSANQGVVFEYTP